MKRAYVRPTMVGERFVANEYVAACGDSGKVYKFECNAGGGVPGNVYQETNGESGLQRGKVTNVIIWRGKDGHNVHCTTQLNMDEWATAKS